MTFTNSLLYILTTIVPGVTALYAAVGGGHLKIVEMLIAAKARVHVVDIDGLTPLHEAANSGHAPLVQLLLKRGAKAQHAAHSSGATVGLRSLLCIISVFF